MPSLTEVDPLADPRDWKGVVDVSLPAVTIDPVIDDPQPTLPATVTGKVTLVVKRGKKTVRKLSTTMTKSGRKKFALPRLAHGTYKVVVKYGGTADHTTSKGTAKLKVTAR